jgi:DNA-binding transcriptional regulator YbjK
MRSLRERALDSAIELLGTRGLRSLTHARVDEHAGLPRGSTSNYFRTRAALLDGVVSWLTEQELASAAPDFDPSTASADDLIDFLCALITMQTGAYRARTIARYVLFLEGANNDALRAPLVQNRRRFEQWTQSILTTMGAPSPVAATKAFMACADGLVLHRVTVDPDAELRPAVAIAVHGCLGRHAPTR